jgi:hypothetical protein
MYRQVLKLLLPGHVLSLTFPVLHPLQDLQHGGGRVQEGLRLFLLLKLSTLQRKGAFVVRFGMS